MAIHRKFSRIVSVIKFSKMWPKIWWHVSVTHSSSCNSCSKPISSSYREPGA